MNDRSRPSLPAPRRRLLGVAAALATVAASALVALGPVAPASAAPGLLGGYAVSATPTSAPVNSPALVSVTVTNSATSISPLRTVTLTLPTTLTDVAVPTTVRASNGARWNVVRVGRQVRATGGSLAARQSLTLPVLATPRTQGPVVLDTAAGTGLVLLDLLGAVGQSNSDPVLTVTPPVPAGTAVVGCAPGAGYPTGCSTAGTGVDLTGTAPGASTYVASLDPGPQPDVLVARIENTPAGDPRRLLCQTADDALVFDSFNRSKHIVETRYGFGSTAVCFGTPTPFLADDGEGGVRTATFNPASGLYEDRLPDCSALNPTQRPSLPCVESVAFDPNEGPVTITIYAPPGDPRATNG
ncbi:hypothetical protein [Nocardioides sp.]|uniref:hypothetical protein n=1 Tax=Nocardioides sp. TaxID=35761 RepID=UPI0035169059